MGKFKIESHIYCIRYIRELSNNIYIALCLCGLDRDSFSIHTQAMK